MKITMEITPDEIREWSVLDDIEINNVPLIMRHILSGFTDTITIDSDTITRLNESVELKGE